MKVALVLIFNFIFSYGFALHADSTWRAERDAFVKTVKRIELVRVLAEGPFYRDDIYKVKENNPESILDAGEEKGFKAHLISKPVEYDSLEVPFLLGLLFSDSTQSGGLRCYVPRHGVLLYGENDTYLGFVEICFQCEQVRGTLGIPRVLTLSRGIIKRIEWVFERYGLVRRK